MNTPEFPTPWQRKTLWAAISAFSVVVIGGVAVGLLWLISRVLGFLQPILIPFAVAAVMAYLLDPLVAKIVSWGTTRHRAVLAVFAAVTIALVGVLIWIVPAISRQFGTLAGKVPGYTTRATQLAVNAAKSIQLKTGLKLFPEPPAAPESPAPPPREPAPPSVPPDAKPAPPADSTPVPAAGAADSNATDAKPAPELAVAKTPAAELQYDWQQLVSGQWVRTSLPVLLNNAYGLIKNSVGGFLGVFGFLLSLIIVPVYLYYFLIESRHIANSWGDYVPLRASALKDEVVSVVNEINGYLIAFFRGQLVVSLINGTVTGLGLMIVGLEGGLLIGLLLCVLNLIPYLGITLCWIPAVIIASVQGGAGTWISGDPWYLFPLVVTGIFIFVQQVDGFFVTPKIVGESVGLHPMTVIVSVFGWSLLMGGLLGAILAVPMTATVKVLLRRYVWQRKILAEAAVTTEETVAIQSAAGSPPTDPL